MTVVWRISEEEAKRKIYNVSCERYFGFGCEIDEETSNKLEGIHLYSKHKSPLDLYYVPLESVGEMIEDNVIVIDVSCFL